MTDIVIVGAGTAGLTAAIYGVRAGKSVKVFEGEAYGGQIINTPDIENYPGIAHVSGFDFATNLYNQAQELGAEVEFDGVRGIRVNEDETKTVTTSSGEEVQTKTIILATGAKNRPLGLPKEKELTGHGISYCATCDGMFFKGKDVAVNGGGNTALEDAAYLSDLANKVYVIHRRDQFRGDAADVEKLKSKPNVELVLNSNVTKLVGEQQLEAIETTNKLTKEVRTIPVSALFIAIGQMPDNQHFAPLIELDPKGYIVAGEDCHTNVEGIYAAGDCRTKSVRQLTTAAADGAVAATEASKYIG